MAEALAAELETRFEGFKASFGGEELKRAKATLSGALVGNALKATLGPSHNLEDLDYGIRELAYTANQYATATAEDPQDYHALYNHGLILQELASKMEAASDEQISFLQQACAKYAAALAIVPSSAPAMYNWGVALSDLARAVRRRDPAGARDCLHRASQKYSASLKHNPWNPQALNNWGLVLQELSALVTDAGEREQLVRQAVAKFRLAIRSRPDFDRGCYNLGTVFYTFACTLQAEAGNQGSQAGGGEEARARHKQATGALFSSAAQYICLAAALEPGKDIYRKSLSVVRQMLPLPFLRAGCLNAPLPASRGAVEERWRRAWFVLDNASLRAASPMESSLSTLNTGALPATSAAASEEPHLTVPLAGIVTARRCLDPSLPEGHAFWICMQTIPEGIYFVSDDADSADAWVDAILLASHLVSTRPGQSFADALSPSPYKRTPSRMAQ